MRYTTDTKRTLALLLAVVMATSVLAMGFIGGAAADVQESDGIDADDVIAGTDSVEQTITISEVENDENDETIEITNDLNELNAEDIEVPDAGEVTTDHEITNIEANDEDLDEGDDGGNIVLELGEEAGVTDDIEFTIELDLEDISDETVEYNVNFEDGEAEDQTTTFDISEAQPQFDDEDTEVIEETTLEGSQLEVEFDENIQTIADEEDVADAFELENVETADGEEISVSGYNDISGDTITLQLDNFVGSAVDEEEMEVEYDVPDNAGEEADDDDVIAHADDADVPALPSTDDGVSSDAAPTVTNAVVDDDTPNELDVTFSEVVDTPDGEVDISEAFESVDIAGVDLAETEVELDGDTEVTINLDGDVPPAGNAENDLTYEGSPDIEATEGGTEHTTQDDRTIFNDVAPELEEATVQEDGVTVEAVFSDDSNADLAFGEDDLSESLSLDNTDAAIQDETGSFSDGELTFTVEPGVLAAEEDVELEYTDGDAVESQAGITAVESTADPTNNDVVPTFEEAQVTEENPDQLEVTFTEDVDQDVGDGNIDVAVTDAFTLDDGENEYRIKNLESHDEDTVVLNLGEDGGDPVEVPSTADLSEALDYEPSDPDGDEEDPFIAASGTEEPVGEFLNKEVNNNVGITAFLTERGEELHVVFTGDVDRVGTPSEVENAFDVDNTAIDLEDSFDRIDGDTVVFSNDGDATEENDFVEDEEEYHSDLDLSGDFDFTSADGDDPLEVDGETAEDFSNEDIRNDIQPFITDADESEDEVELTYSEEIDASGTDTETFELSNTDAEVNSIDDGGADNELTLELDPVFEVDDTDIELTYTGAAGAPVESDQGDSDAVALDETVGLDNPVTAAPVLQNATVDDAGINNEGDDGEMLLAFDQDVQLVGSEDDVSGLEFESNNVDVAVTLDDLNDPTESPDNVVVAEFDSDSGSDESNIQQGDDLSGAELEVQDAGDVDIESTAGDEIAETTLTDVRNEIAGDIAEVDASEIEAELLASEEEAQDSGDFDVTVSGFSDGDYQVIDAEIDINLTDQNDEELENIDLEAEDVRFNDEVTVNVDYDAGEVDGDAVGEEVDVTVDEGETTITPDDADTVEFVHETFEIDEGWAIVSQPTTGDLATDSDITDQQLFNATDNSFEHFTEADDAESVHHGLYLFAEDDNAVYGFAFEEDRGGDAPGTFFEMEEGWNVVSTNFDINEEDEETIDADLAFGDDPAVSDDAVRPWTLNDNYQISEFIENDDVDESYGEVEDDEAYAVFLHEEADRPLQFVEYEPES